MSAFMTCAIPMPVALSALGEGLSMIGRLLGHTQVQTTARYAHLANDPVKSAAGRVSDTIGAAMLGKVSKAENPERPKKRRQTTSSNQKSSPAIAAAE